LARPARLGRRRGGPAGQRAGGPAAALGVLPAVRQAGRAGPAGGGGRMGLLLTGAGGVGPLGPAGTAAKPAGGAGKAEGPSRPPDKKSAENQTRPAPADDGPGTTKEVEREDR